jgi:hypothetical protein
MTANNVLMSQPTIRTRLVTDLDRCVEALRVVHGADAYPGGSPQPPPHPENRKVNPDASARRIVRIEYAGFVPLLIRRIR